MNLLSLFASLVFAAEMVVSPLAGEVPAIAVPLDAPEISFGSLLPLDPTTPVLGASDEPIPIPLPPPTPAPCPARKKSYRIAVIGDSMVDTLGPGVPHLAAMLKRRCPSVTFTILNYGVGGTNIDYGLYRLTNGYTYLGEEVPPLVSHQPDIVVVESFGYNPYPFDEGALDRHWTELATIVDTLRLHIPSVKLVLAATIAPNSEVFGDGALNWDEEGKSRKAAEIKRYIENALRFAQSERLPFADAYHPSLDRNGEGALVYINPGDRIHYSDAGRELFGRIVANTIMSAKLLE